MTDKYAEGAASAAPSPKDNAEGKGAQVATESTEQTPGTAGVDGADSDKLAEEAIEAEAAAVIDNALDEVEAEAAAEAAKREAAEWQDKYIRLHAEWDTYRRRMDEQRKAEKVRAAEKLVTSLLPVIDDLERTIDYADKNGETGITDGVRAVLTKFVDTLKKDGVGIIDPAGQAFDALEAQAVGTVDDASVPDETVAQVYQKGYKLGEKVLRPAMVTVTTGGPKRTVEEEQ
jgi:molecular chaperone GrpE